MHSKKYRNLNKINNMTQEQFSKYSLSLSIGLHALLITLLIVSLTFHSQRNSMHAFQNIKIIQAVAVNSSVVEKQFQHVGVKSTVPTVSKHKEIIHHIPKKTKVAEKPAVKIQKKQSVIISKPKKVPPPPPKKIEVKKYTIETKKTVKRLKLSKDRSRPVPTKAKKTLVQKAVSAKESMKALMAKQAAEEDTLEKQLDAEQQAQTILDKYKTMILNTIGQHWIMPKNVNKNLSTQLLIHLAPGGMVLNVDVIKSSGDSVLDRSVITAIWKSSPLPVPNDPLMFDQFRLLHLTVKPEGLLYN
ncbi:MAG: cell envelope integrity protein TolA [Gammaproteobacteria bacterium]|nr:cell envelope integrity protein TolA [Gammaproteobacteria bacterium]